jgi:hypothetical protein
MVGSVSPQEKHMAPSESGGGILHLPAHFTGYLLGRDHLRDGQYGDIYTQKDFLSFILLQLNSFC